MEWIGVALGIAGLGLALLPFTFGDHIEILRNVEGRTATVGLLVLGALLCFIPLWKRSREKKRPIPLAFVKKWVNGHDAFAWMQTEDAFGEVVSLAAKRSMVKLFGIPGELKGISDKLEEIPISHFDNHNIWVSWSDRGIVSETYRNDIGFLNALATDKGRYFNLHASKDILEKLVELRREGFVPKPRKEREKIQTPAERLVSILGPPSTPTSPHA
jgi:hypothetical protein